MPQPTLSSAFAADLPELARPWRPSLPDPERAPAWLAVNTDLAEELGIDLQWLAGAEGLAVLGGRAAPTGGAGSAATEHPRPEPAEPCASAATCAWPVAQAYAGHQFGGYSPLLGDGRAVLLGELTDPAGRVHDLALKGSGRTVFSRGGDGRAVIGPVLREFLVAEAMHALGVPTTRALAAVDAGDRVWRDGRMPPGAVLARVAASHLRVGTFELARQVAPEPGRGDLLARLVDHALARHYPHRLGVPSAAGDPGGVPSAAADPGGAPSAAADRRAVASTSADPGGVQSAAADRGAVAFAAVDPGAVPLDGTGAVAAPGGGAAHADRALALLEEVIAAQAQTIADWMSLGFIHGVMNTDNMALSGQTIDYGPCAWIEAYDPDAVFSSIDTHGRYRFGNQPAIALWNLSRFAETLLPLLDDEPERGVEIATAALEPFAGRYHAAYLARMRRKLGLPGAEPGDAELVDDLLGILRDSGTEWTGQWRALADELRRDAVPDAPPGTPASDGRHDPPADAVHGAPPGKPGINGRHDPPGDAVQGAAPDTPAGDGRHDPPADSPSAPRPTGAPVTAATGSRVAVADPDHPADPDHAADQGDPGGQGDPGAGLRARQPDWWRRWRERLGTADPLAVADAMDAVNPAYVPRNHLVEEALAAAEQGDLAPFEALLAAVRDPYRAAPERAHLTGPAPAGFTARHVTYCGT